MFRVTEMVDDFTAKTRRVDMIRKVDGVETPDGSFEEPIRHEDLTAAEAIALGRALHDAGTMFTIEAIARDGDWVRSILPSEWLELATAVLTTEGT